VLGQRKEKTAINGEKKAVFYKTEDEKERPSEGGYK